MNIEVRRKWFSDKATIGEVYINGAFECFSLEDKVRETNDPVVEWKIPGKTAIPIGGYDVIIDMSARFKRLMPHVLNVPGFEGVRIHSGNTSENTEGCILVGQTRATDFIGNSRPAFDALFQKIGSALAQGQAVRINIMDSSASKLLDTDADHNPGSKPLGS